MKKLFLGISAMFLFIAGTAPVLGQGQSLWPEFDPYPKKASTYNGIVDDGFGGNWNITSYIGFILLKRSTNEFPLMISESPPHYFKKELKFDERSLPPDAGINVAFYGYLTKLAETNNYISVLLYVNEQTGEIDEVGYVIGTQRNGKIILSVPPRNFTILEDILKKTVKFKPPLGILDKERSRRYAVDPKNGIYYQFYIDFPAPAEGEPDFLGLSADKD